MKKTALIGSALWAAPLLAFAQTAQNLRGLLALAGDLLNMLIPILIALTLVIFFWGLAMYVRGAGKSAGQGKSIMIAGLLALFIMVSVWGIIRLFQNTLGVQGGAPIPPPYVPTTR
jgi:Na+-driven multidrug efflux pump